MLLIRSILYNSGLCFVFSVAHIAHLLTTGNGVLCLQVLLLLFYHLRSPPLRQNQANRCDHEADQEKPPCLKHRRALWCPFPPPWPIFFLPHPPPYPCAQPCPTPRLPSSCEGQVAQPWLPPGTPLPFLHRDEPAEAPAARHWEQWGDGLRPGPSVHCFLHFPPFREESPQEKTPLPGLLF